MDKAEIENWAERKMDRFDYQLLHGLMTQEEYDAALEWLGEETERRYAELAK